MITTMLTKEEALKLDNESPALQLVRLGDQLRNAQRFFSATARIAAAAAGSAIELLPDSNVHEDRRVYILGLFAKVDGATAWSGGSFTELYLQDSNGTPVVFFTAAVAALTANALLVPGVANLTAEDPFALATGGTLNKGLQIVGDADAGAGSDLVVTVFGMIDT